MHNVTIKQWIMINGQCVSLLSDTWLLIDAYCPCVTMENSHKHKQTHIHSGPSKHVKANSIYKGIEVGLGL